MIEVPAPPGPRSRYVSGRGVALGLVALIAVAIAAAIVQWYATLWPSGPVLGRADAGDGRALVFREGHQAGFAVDMVLVDAEDEPVWRRSLYGLQHTPPEGIAVEAGAVVVQALDAEQAPQVHRFSLEDGAFVPPE